MRENLVVNDVRIGRHGDEQLDVAAIALRMRGHDVADSLAALFGAVPAVLAADFGKMVGVGDELAHRDFLALDGFLRGDGRGHKVDSADDEARDEAGRHEVRGDFDNAVLLLTHFAAPPFFTSPNMRGFTKRSMSGVTAFMSSSA